MYETPQSCFGKFDFNIAYPTVRVDLKIHYVSKKYHPTTNDNFNTSCPITIIFGTNITERIRDR